MAPTTPFKGLRVALGLILSNGFPVPPAFVLGLLELQMSVLTGETNSQLPDDLKIDSLRAINAQGFPIDAARNEVCRAFLEGGEDFLLFLDADMRHPRDLLARLLRARKPLISGRYQMRRPPHHTVAMRKVGEGAREYKAVEEQHGLIEIDAAGAGALLIHRDVLNAVQARNEELAVLEDAGANPVQEWFRYQIGENGLRSVSEDMWFFERAKAAGVQAWCDLDAVCSHVASFEVDPHWQAPYLDAKARVEGAQRRVKLPGEV